MKQFLTFILVCALLGPITLISQNNISTQGGGEVNFPKNNTPCLSPDQRENIKQILTQNIAQLRAENRLIESTEKGSHPLFSWPVAQANGFNFNSVWVISGYVDHNQAYPNQIEDYNCGTHSYDTQNGYNHKGTDIATWPFWWKQMDDNQAINVAAAAGQIIGKSDGNYDRNCGFNSDNWNSIYIRHSDGSVAWYGHMKEGSLTSKTYGDTVAQGEFLGVIGSSGNSTGPHLHFEVYDENNNLIDPFEGSCNSLNAGSWWQDQKPYFDPTLNAALTHTAPPEFQPCPNTAITHESNQFDLNQTVYFISYLKNQATNSIINITINRPDGTLFRQIDFTMTQNFLTSYWYWSYAVDMEGIWTWETTYGGETISRQFNVGVLGNNDNAFSNFKAYPNPTNTDVTLQLGNSYSEISVSIYNMLGQEISQNKYTNTALINTKIQGENGVYFATIKTDTDISETLKIIKQD